MAITTVVPSSLGFILNGTVADAQALSNATVYASAGDAGGPGVPGCLAAPFSKASVRRAFYDDRAACETTDPALAPNTPAVVRGDVRAVTIVNPGSDFMADWLSRLTNSGLNRSAPIGQRQNY